MDIHRCRFVPYPPSTINALAFSHSHISNDQKTAPPRLAVGRANGDIEIWNPLNGSWLQEIIIHGGKDRSVDGLVWIQDPNEEDITGRIIIGKSRLFSIGYTTTVTEWDLEKGKPLRQASGNHGEIWCLAAQPAYPHSRAETNGTSGQWEGQNLITGCTDGALVLYSTRDADLQLQRVLVRPSVKRAKIISVVFQDRNIVIAGCTDSTIRVYDIRNGSMIRSMSLGAGPSGGPKEIIIWSVKALPNGNLVSGDSTGELRVWDGKTYTLMQRISGHRQDILSLATSFDGSTIFSGGMDRRTVVYKQVGRGNSRWAEVGHRRYHSHDVKTMATLETSRLSIVVSGGPDASPTVLPIRQFGMENQRALPFLPQEPMVLSAPSKRLMLSWWDREVHIWSLSKPSKSTSEEEPEIEPAVQNRKLVAKILLKGEANITSASLSADGSLLAASTAVDIKVFQLKARKVEEDGGLKVSKIVLPWTLSSGARLVQFSTDGKWLCVVREDSRIVMARVVSDQSSAPSLKMAASLSKLQRINRHTEQNVLVGGLGAYDRTITQISFSSDSRILAVSDLAGYIDTFVLSGVEDVSASIPDDISEAASSSDSDSENSVGEEEAQPRPIFGQHWTRNPSASLLPKLPSAAVVLSFRPTAASARKGLVGGTITHATRHNPHPASKELPAGEDRMVVVTAESQIFEFNVLKGALTQWSRRNPTSIFPEDFRKIRDQARGTIWDISRSRERLWLYGAGWLWMFDLSRDFPWGGEVAYSQVQGYGTIKGRGESADATKTRKRKRTGKSDTTGAGSTIPDEMLGTGISRNMQRNIHQEVDEMLDLGFGSDGDVEAMDVDENEDQMGTLERLRRNDRVAAVLEVKNGNGPNESAEIRPNYWNTFKYRPILGMVVIGEAGGENEDEDENVGPEVALVERPIWEADLPPRYYGDQEWENGSL